MNGNALGERPGSGRAPSPPPSPPPPFTASVSLPAITEAISGRIGACVAAIPSALLPLVRRDGEQSEVTVAGGERGGGGRGRISCLIRGYRAMTQGAGVGGG